MNTLEVQLGDGAAGNIGKLQVLNGLSEALIFIPVAVLFFAAAGLSLAEIMLLQSIFSLAMVLLEIPTGYISDRWGRKNTLIASCILDIVGIGIYAMSYSFWGFVVGEILLAFGSSLHSGTVEALTYDSLLEIGQERRNRQAAGRLIFAGMLGQAFAALLGGVAAVVSLRLTLWLTLIPLAGALVVALSLYEPKRLGHEEQKHWQVLKKIAADALVHNASVRSVIILSSVIGTMTLLLFWYSQPYQQEVGLPLSLFGVVHAVMLGSTAVAALWTHKLVAKIDDRCLMVVAAVVVVAMCLALSLPASMLGLVWLLIGRSVWGVTSVVSGDLINRLTVSGRRATVLSIRSCIGRLMFVAVAPLAGQVADASTLPQVLLWTCVVGSIILTACFISMRNIWAQLPR